MRITITLLVLQLSSVAIAQPYLLGNRSVTFFDAARNRSIATEVHYPGVSAGSNVDVADGAFPVLVMGHGFVMTVNAYYNLRDHLVPRGYVLVLPTTEGGFSPNHANFGQDLAFLAQAMQGANSDVASPFYGHVAPASALMGHSMGGGASFLGAANNGLIQALVNFAPAETTPSAIAAAANVLVPTLVFAGANDCVTPISQHQGPMYDALTVPCRAFVSILGGGHCYFGNSNFNCAFGESTCQPQPSITREQQHAVINDFATLWLDHFLKGDEQAFMDVQDSITQSTRVNGGSTCISTSIRAVQQPQWNIGPVPADDLLFVNAPCDRFTAKAIDAHGRTILAAQEMNNGGSIDVSEWPAGAYRLILLGKDGVFVRAVVITH